MRGVSFYTRVAMPAFSDNLSELIHDWNQHDVSTSGFHHDLQLVDETLRDGLQNASVTDPPVEQKLLLVENMVTVGVDVINVGLPASSDRAVQHATRLASELGKRWPQVARSASGRTLDSDVDAICEVTQQAGVNVEAYLFVASSPIRKLVEGWDQQTVLERSRSAIERAVRCGLDVSFVLEDATRTRPERLRDMFHLAANHGVRRVCLADTVGQMIPQGVRSLVKFSRGALDEVGGKEIQLEWHGHNDRGMALACTLTAAQEGVQRLHGTALGIGERVGNAPMELLLVNLKLMNAHGDRDLSALSRYCEEAARALDWQLPITHPVFGRDAFRTATGVHAAAINKARATGNEHLADLAYASVPASWIGRTQQIEIGPMSGDSNVLGWLNDRGLTAPSSLRARVLQVAKRSGRVLREDEVLAIVREGTHE